MTWYSLPTTLSPAVSDSLSNSAKESSTLQVFSSVLYLLRRMSAPTRYVFDPSSMLSISLEKMPVCCCMLSPSAEARCLSPGVWVSAGVGALSRSCMPACMHACTHARACLGRTRACVCVLAGRACTHQHALLVFLTTWCRGKAPCGMRAAPAEGRAPRGTALRCRHSRAARRKQRGPERRGSRQAATHTHTHTHIQPRREVRAARRSRGRWHWRTAPARRGTDRGHTGRPHGARTPACTRTASAAPDLASASAAASTPAVLPMASLAPGLRVASAELRRLSSAPAQAG